MAPMTIARTFASLTVAVAIILTTLLPTGYGNDESDALTTAKGSLTDPDNVLQSWDASLVDPCTWYHITCDANNKVTRIDLGSSNLSGQLDKVLATLSNLQYLEFFQNNIDGNIPVEFGDLTNLVSLDLYNNRLSGSIPSSLGKLKSVKFLRLNNNNLNGPIPVEIGDMSSLAVLDLSNNNLCGIIPPAVASIPGANFQNNPGLGRPC